MKECIYQILGMWESERRKQADEDALSKDTELNFFINQVKLYGGKDCQRERGVDDDHRRISFRGIKNVEFKENLPEKASNI